ncbi:hypothetical protein QTI33_31915 [Variovorax sp. J22P271]|uniref:hypothetical protein n=1 Tax=Variovorax davisae TaxID=3053515 RepID=UPI002575F5E3|nr:hypothetical protein [Variovorax sp. J22P271]MDM0036780.1 hypothetical protein [Variovorax sp. J22P271]
MKNIPSAKPFVFVLMPFASSFDDVYKLGIKKACEEEGAYCERVDEQMFDGSILDRIYNQIVKSDVVIADMTGKNPNVFYETGYAHALNKKVILLTQDQDDIPFDLKHYPHIVYAGRIGDLAEKLKPRLAWALKESQMTGTGADDKINYSVHGKGLIEGMEAEIVEFFDEESRSLARVLQIDILNESSRTLRPEDLDLGIVIESFTGRNASRLEDGRYWHVVTGLSEIFPGSRRPVLLRLEIPHGADYKKLSQSGVNVCLKEISRFGHRSINFTAKLKSREILEFGHHFDGNGIPLPVDEIQPVVNLESTVGITWDDPSRKDV